MSFASIINGIWNKTCEQPCLCAALTVVFGMPTINNAGGDVVGTNVGTALTAFFAAATVGGIINEIKQAREATPPSAAPTPPERTPVVP